MSYNITHYDFFLSLINVYLKLIPEHTCIAYKSAKKLRFSFFVQMYLLKWFKSDYYRYQRSFS